MKNFWNDLMRFEKHIDVLSLHGISGVVVYDSGEFKLYDATTGLQIDLGELLGECLCN